MKKSKQNMKNSFIEENNQYDKAAKRAIRNVEILVPLLRDFVNDLADLSDDDLRKILSDVKVETVSHPGKKKGYVIPDNFLTIRNDLPLPNGEERHEKIHIDIEIQNKYDYNIVRRNENYINLMKAKYNKDDGFDHKFYSIWVFLNPRNDDEGHIDMMPSFPYRLDTGKFIYMDGSKEAFRSFYLYLYTSEENVGRIKGKEFLSFKILCYLFSKALTVEQKEAALRECYVNVNDHDLTKEMNTMDDFMTPVYNYGIEKGEKRGIAKGEKRGIEKGSKLTAEITLMLLEGKTDEEIAQAIPDSKVEQIRELRKYLGDYLK